MIYANGRPGAKVVVVCDAPPQKCYDERRMMTPPTMDVFSREMRRVGLGPSDCVFINCSPPIPEEAAGSDKRTNEFLDTYKDEFKGVLGGLLPGAKLVIYLGKHSGKQLLGRAVKITQERGQIHQRTVLGHTLPVLPLYSPAYVRTRPEVEEIFQTDVQLVGALREADWDLGTYQDGRLNGNYRWCMDLQFLLNDPPTAVACDCETIGYKWYQGSTVLCVQLSWKKGTGIAIPLDIDYWNNEGLRGESSRHLPKLTLRGRMKLIHQLRELASNREINFIGHNFKFDVHMMRGLGIEIANWAHDTMQLAFVVDDNMQNKGLDECIRRWIPAHSGYADSFNAHTDKGAMQNVPHDEMLSYAAADADVTRQLGFKLVKLAKEDRRNYNCYTRIQMPALRAFSHMEREGVHVDTAALKALGRVAGRQEHELYQSLISRVPGAIKRKHLEDPKMHGKPVEKTLSFGRANFVIDILFDHPEGFKLKPLVFTKTTARMSPEGRIPSTSAKDHLPFFADRMDMAGEFIRDLIDYTKLQKLRSTYIGEDTHTVYQKVSPLKRGDKYPKRVQEALEGAGVGFEAKPPSEEDAPDREVSRIPLGESSLVMDSSGRPWIREGVDASGFWKYMNRGNGATSIHPSFMLHRTVTGRTACVAGDTVIGVNRGGDIHWIKFSEIRKGDEVWTHKCRWRPVLRGFIKPVQEMWEVEFSNGDVLRCTEDHRLLTDDEKWVSLRHVCIKETLEGSGIEEESRGSLSQLIADYAASGGRAWRKSSYGDGYSEGGYPRGGAGFSEVSEVFQVEGGVEEPHAREAPRDIQGGLRGWEGLLYESGPWETAFRSSDSVCGEGSRYQSGGSFGVSSNSPHRRGHGEQSSRQPSSHDEESSCRDPRKVCEVERGVKITGIKSIGSRQVFDIEVEEDHSYCVAGCFSHNSVDPNGQNIPKRGTTPKMEELVQAYRRVFVARPGHVLVSADLSQAELRLVAWTSGDPTMLRVYREGGDIHAMTAARTMGLSLGEFMKLPKEERKLARFRAKAVNFGFIYGMWWRKFRSYAKTDYGLDLTDRESEKLREDFFELYSGLEDWHWGMKDFVKEHEYVRSLHGALRRLPAVRSSDEGVMKEAQRQAINSPIQRLASDLGLVGMTRFAQCCPWDRMHPILFIHDDVVVEAREEDAMEAASALKYFLQTPPLWEWFNIESPIPILSDVSIGTSLGNMVEIKGVEAIAPEWEHDIARRLYV